MGDNVALRFDQQAGVGGGGTKVYFYNGSSWVAAESGNDYAGTGLNHYMALINPGSSNQKLWRNGTQIATASHSGSISYTNGTDTFLLKHGNGSTSWDCDAVIHEVVVWNTARTVTDAQKIYNARRKRVAQQIDSSNIIACLELDDKADGADADGATYRDCSSNGNDFTAADNG